MKSTKSNSDKQPQSIADSTQENAGASLQPPAQGVVQRQVIQTKCDDDSAGGSSMNESFDAIRSKNSAKEQPFSLQRKAL